MAATQGVRGFACEAPHPFVVCVRHRRGTLPLSDCPPTLPTPGKVPFAGALLVLQRVVGCSGALCQIATPSRGFPAPVPDRDKRPHPKSHLPRNPFGTALRGVGEGEGYRPAFGQAGHGLFASSLVPSAANNPGEHPHDGLLSEGQLRQFRFPEGLLAGVASAGEQ